MIRYVEDAIEYLIDLKLPIGAVEHIRRIVVNKSPSKNFCKNLVIDCGATEEEWSLLEKAFCEEEPRSKEIVYDALVLGEGEG